MANVRPLNYAGGGLYAAFDIQLYCGLRLVHGLIIRHVEEEFIVLHSPTAGWMYILILSKKNVAEKKIVVFRRIRHNRGVVVRRGSDQLCDGCKIMMSVRCGSGARRDDTVQTLFAVHSFSRV